MRAVQRGLDNLDIEAAESNSGWTKAIKTELCNIGKTFGFKVGARAGEVAESDRDYGEFLYDVTWLEYEGESVTDAPLVAECEWGNLQAIDDDFQKLLLARAAVRVMIFDGNYEPGSVKIVERLARQAGTFRRSREEDVWLLAAWERTGKNEKGWSFRWFTVDKGAASDFPVPRIPRR